MTNAHTRNPHDGGFDIATGQDVSCGEVVGRIFWDRSDPANVGLVIRWYDGDEETPDTANMVIGTLAACGYELDTASQDDIRSLVPGKLSA